MSPSLEQGPLREAAILTRAVENVFRKLIRLLIGRMSLIKLQEMIRIIFVDEAERKLASEALGENVSLSRLGVETGLDTRTLKKVRHQIAESSELANKNFVEGLNPLLRVYDFWMSDERYFDTRTNKPRILTIEDQENMPGFSQLIKNTMPARGVTSNAVLKRLEQKKMIKIDSSENRVELIPKEGSFVGENEMDLIGIGMDATADLLDTVSHNIENSCSPENRLYQRGFWNYQISQEKVHEIRKIIRSFLEKSDIEGRELITKLAEKEKGPGQITAGIGMYYFEKNDGIR